MATPRSKRSLTNQDESQQINQSNLVYYLEWTKRDDLIFLLNSYSSFILCKSSYDKEELMKRNLDLYQNLTSLSSKSTAKKSRKSNNFSNTSALNRPVLELDYDTKSKIINCLSDNQSWTFSSDCFVNDVKLNLVNQNNELVCELLKLPFELLESMEWSVEPNSCDLKSNENNSSTNDKLLKEIDLLKKEFEDLKENFKNSKQQIDTNLSEISNSLKKTDVSKVEHIFEFDEISKFIDSNLDDLKQSPSIFCNQISIPWYIILKKREIGKMKYLSVSLHPKCETNLNYSIDTEIKLTILNKSKKFDKFYSFKQLFKSKENIGYGSNMITLNCLKTGGFMKDNKIEIKVELQINKLIC